MGGGFGGGFGGGLAGPIPRDLALLLGALLLTYSLQFFAATAALPALLRLSPAVWQRGFVWQVVTYPFSGASGGGLWLVIELLVLYLFARDVYVRLGRRGFWQLLVGVSALAGLVAAAVHVVASLAGVANPLYFSIMQGHRTLLAIVIAAFATLHSRATIYLFFVLPIQASWFLGLELLFAFLAFLPSKDLSGLLGVWCAVGATWAWLGPGTARASLRRLRLRLEERWLRWRLRADRRRRGIRLVDPDDDEPKRGPWMH